ncbi:MAG TPA: hypothetical protein PK509_12230, partial [Catalimonadaceae bacterium]|nr:hypothetical protein [Catalimonadaceae bacterium]
EWKDEHHGIQTYFEDKFTKKGFKINYMKFRLPLLAEPDGPTPPIYFRGEAVSKTAGTEEQH